MTSEGVLGDIQSASVVIGNRVWLGANVTVTKGVTIGDGLAIAAVAVVTNNIPP